MLSAESFKRDFERVAKPDEIKPVKYNVFGGGGRKFTADFHAPVSNRLQLVTGWI
jgi:hypothetical protein